jgi:hypothetical protein
MASQWRQQGLGFEALSIYFVIGGGASLDPCPVPAQQPTSKPSSSGRPSWSPTRGKEGEEERRRAGAREETEPPRCRTIRLAAHGRVRIDVFFQLLNPID